MKGGRVVGLGSNRAGRFLPWLVTVLEYLDMMAVAVAFEMWAGRLAGALVLVFSSTPGRRKSP